ncbi:O-methyltransferase [Stenotrophomonas lactitubi]|uniref:O-methyltransferase n=1 Tax=Stenotrophomonas lactitubi TaxID=2045214 RepID=UPI003CCD9077
MDLAALKDELARFGTHNDARESERGRRMLNITADTGELLSVLVRFGNARRVLEIGTSNGYSTLWLAEAAAAIDGTVITLEFAADKVAMARANFARSGLGERIELVHGDAGQWLAQAADGCIDLLFLDSNRGQYAGWWPPTRRSPPAWCRWAMANCWRCATPDCFTGRCQPWLARYCRSRGAAERGLGSTEGRPL